MTDPSIQLIANLVVVRDDGHVLLARYDPGGESDDPDAPVRWWLPGQQLEPYEHPDDVARSAIAGIGGVTAHEIELVGVQSFRGRRGWHVSFDYRVTASGEPTDEGVPALWCDPDRLPRTMHGGWERSTIHRVLGG
jgi:ADP-ribose pyrophosphatase YjhB (NUDIX family)